MSPRSRAGVAPARRGCGLERARCEPGQASVLVVGGLVAVVLGALVLGLVARGGGREARAQRAADLAALAGARAMHDAYARLFEPVFADRARPGPRHLPKAAYLALGRAAAEGVAAANGARDTRVEFPDADSFAPVRVRVTVRDRFEVRAGEARRSAPIQAGAEAELAPPGELAASGGGYDGPLAERHGERMRPDVARAFDRLDRAARADGVALLITSGFRSDAEQAVLYARHPDPRWVAPPGRSLHRLGTELDLGPPSAYGWLGAHAERFHFTQRYSWEPWHFGYMLNAHSSPPPGPTARSARRCRTSSRPHSRPRSPAPRSAGTCPRRCSQPSSTRSRTSTRSRSAPRARRASRSSCPAPRTRWGCATRSTPGAPSTPRRA